jgi:hypothetical protein
MGHHPVGVIGRPRRGGGVVTADRGGDAALGVQARQPPTASTGQSGAAEAGRADERATEGTDPSAEMEEGRMLVAARETDGTGGTAGRVAAC